MNPRWRQLLKTYGSVIAASVTSLIALSVYWLTLAPDITWANYGVDGGDLITAVVTRGNPHPSGYPTYLLLGYLIEKLPLWPIAYRFNFFSALTMAGATGFAAATAYALAKTTKTPHNNTKILVAVTTGLTLAFAALVWGQAVITEVYGLFMLLSAAYLWSLLTQKHAWLTGFLLGLAITAHSTGWLLLPISIFLVPGKKILTLLIGLLLGLAPFVFLPILVTPTSPVIWGELNTIQGWWWLISSQIYRGYGFELPPNLWLDRLSEWSLPILTQFTWAGIPLIIAAFFIMTEKHRRVYWLLLGTAVLYITSAFFYHTNDSLIFTLPAWLLLSFLLVPTYKRLGWLSLMLPLALILINFQANNLKDNHFIRQNTESLLAEVPERAILETPGDPTIFTLWYIIFAEKKRTDIIPIDHDLFAFDWYRDRLQRLYPDLEGLAQDNLPDFRDHTQEKRPYCFASLTETDTNKQSNYSLTCSQAQE